MSHSLDNTNVNEINLYHSHQATYYLLDALNSGALTYYLPLSSSAAFDDVIRQYESYINSRYAKETIVFDGYKKLNIKKYAA